jgi:hypothetical protein
LIIRLPLAQLVEVVYAGAARRAVLEAERKIKLMSLARLAGWVGVEPRIVAPAVH